MLLCAESAGKESQSVCNSVKVNALFETDGRTLQTHRWNDVHDVMQCLLIIHCTVLRFSLSLFLIIAVVLCGGIDVISCVDGCMYYLYSCTVFIVKRRISNAKQLNSKRCRYVQW